MQWACTTARPRRPLGSVRSGLVSAVTRRATRVSANVAKLQVALENGQTIPLSQMASVQYKLEQPSIWRRGLLPTITVQADVVPGIEAKTVNGQLAPALAELGKELPAGDTIEAGGTVEESAKGLRSIALIFPMIIFLMPTILMVQLQSFQNMFLVISLALLGLIGFGIEMPMSLTILGVFGGFIGFGFLGLFIGATLIAIMFTLV